MAGGVVTADPVIRHHPARPVIGTAAGIAADSGVAPLVFVLCGRRAVVSSFLVGAGGSGWRRAVARAAAARGWPVFPLHPYSKYPAVTDWEHRASTDPDQVAAWWPGESRDNIGIACGPAGLVVVDLDPARGQAPPPPWDTAGVTHGRQVLAILAERAGAALPTATFTVATPSGGQHLYFLAPAGVTVRNTAGALGWRVDIRAAGGFVVAAGSCRWVNGRTRRYTVTDPAPPVPLPDWLTTSLTARGAPRPANDGRACLGEGLVEQAGAYVAAAIDAEARAVTRAAPGTRNSTLFRAAAALGELVGAGLVTADTVTDMLRRAAAVHCGVDDFTPTEADRTISNGLTRGRRNPRSLTG